MEFSVFQATSFISVFSAMAVHVHYHYHSAFDYTLPLTDSDSESVVSRASVSNSPPRESPQEEDIPEPPVERGSFVSPTPNCKKRLLDSLFACNITRPHRKPRKAQKTVYYGPT